METNQILHADILDILFDGKNKSYGAYDLRRSYNKRMRKAMLFSFSVIALLCIASAFAKSSDNNYTTIPYVNDPELGKVKKEKEPIRILPPAAPAMPKSPIAAATPAVKQQIFKRPVIVDNNINTNTIDEIKDGVAISNVTNLLGSAPLVVQAPQGEIGTNVVSVIKADAEDPDHIFIKVEKEAEYPGGTTAWSNFLRKNLHPEIAAENGAEAGRYVVEIQFVVSADGTLSNIKPQTNIGFGLEDEAVRIIRKTQRWIPALQNGRYVNAYRKQTVVFVVADN